MAGEGEEREAWFRYSVGPFRGRDTPLTLREGRGTTLRFRIPLELLHARERLTVEVFGGSPTGPGQVLWSKRYSVIWQEKAPCLEPVTE